jgi:hypothetical protein
MIFKQKHFRSQFRAWKNFIPGLYFFINFTSIKVLVWLKVSQVELIASKCKNFKRLFSLWYNNLYDT